MKASDFIKEWDGQYLDREDIERLLEQYAAHKEQDGWIEIKEGNELPDYDEYVLWLQEDGNCFWEALDKDGNPWLGSEEEMAMWKMPKTTHWKRITLPAKYNNHDGN